MGSVSKAAVQISHWNNAPLLQPALLLPETALSPSSINLVYSGL